MRHAILLLTGLLLMGVGFAAAISALSRTESPQRLLFAIGVFVLIAGIVTALFAIVGLVAAA